MPRWIRSYWDEEDVTFVWEVADDGWIQRSVEQVGPERNPRSAAALAEVIAARDAGGISAVQAYEASHGLLPDQPIDDWAFPHEDITESEFERDWDAARSALER